MIIGPKYKIAKRLGAAVFEKTQTQKFALFVNLAETHEITGVPHWLTFDAKKLSGEKKAEPTYEVSESIFDAQQVLEYYSR